MWADDEGPGIAMTRTLGDFQGKKIGLISIPEIQHIELTHSDKFIVLGSGFLKLNILRRSVGRDEQRGSVRVHVPVLPGAEKPRVGG